jgi:multiple sugar transport system substrate-binding protein/putative aldouronate transport system substrate-binding protein
MGSALYNTPDHLAAGKGMFPVKPEEAKPIRYGLNIYGGNRIWSIGANTEYPELCMAIINYLVTPEGRMNSEYGPKGLIWDYDAEGYTYLTDLGKKCVADNTTELTGGEYTGTKKDGECQINCVTWSIDSINLDSKVGETYNWQAWRTTMGDPKNDADKDWREFNNATTVNEYMEKGKYTVSPGSTYVMGQQSDELKTTWAQVTKCIREYSWKAVYAKDDAEFNKLVNGMKGMAKQYGYQKCWDWTNEEAAKRKAAEDEAKKLAAEE